MEGWLGEVVVRGEGKRVGARDGGGDGGGDLLLQSSISVRAFYQIYH